MRVRTESFAIIVPTLANFPTSRRNSRNPMGPNQSRLFMTSTARPLLPKRRRSSSRMPFVFFSICATQD